MYELSIQWPKMSAEEAAELVKPAQAVLDRHGFTAAECFHEMFLQDTGQPFNPERANAWVEAERALQALGAKRPVLCIAERCAPAGQLKPEELLEAEPGR